MSGLWHYTNADNSPSWHNNVKSFTFFFIFTLIACSLEIGMFILKFTAPDQDKLLLVNIIESRFSANEMIAHLFDIIISVLLRLIPIYNFSFVQRKNSLKALSFTNHNRENTKCRLPRLFRLVFKGYLSFYCVRKVGFVTFIVYCYYRDHANSVPITQTIFGAIFYVIYDVFTILIWYELAYISLLIYISLIIINFESQLIGLINVFTKICKYNKKLSIEFPDFDYNYQLQISTTCGGNLIKNRKKLAHNVNHDTPIAITNDPNQDHKQMIELEENITVGGDEASNGIGDGSGGAGLAGYTSNTDKNYSYNYNHNYNYNYNYNRNNYNHNNNNNNSNNNCKQLNVMMTSDEDLDSSNFNSLGIDDSDDRDINNIDVGGSSGSIDTNFGHDYASFYLLYDNLHRKWTEEWYGANKIWQVCILLSLLDVVAMSWLSFSFYVSRDPVEALFSLTLAFALLAPISMTIYFAIRFNNTFERFRKLIISNIINVPIDQDKKTIREWQYNIKLQTKIKEYPIQCDIFSFRITLANVINLGSVFLVSRIISLAIEFESNIEPQPSSL